MRLAILSRDAPPTTGGIADHTALLASSLALAGDTVTLVTRGPADTIPGVTVVSHPRFDTAPVRAIAGQLAAANPEAIIWAYNPFSFGARGLARRGPRIANAIRGATPARLIVFAHELWFPPGREGMKGLLWQFAQRRAGHKIIRAADAVIVTTPDRLAELAALGIDATLIPVGSNLPDAVEPASRADLGIPPEAFLVAHLGGVGPGRDLATGLAAIEAEPRAHLLLIGDTGPLPALPERVHATGRLDALSAAAALAAADAYLHLDPVGPTPGRRTTLAAALQAGLPILGFAGEQTDSAMAPASRLVPPGDAPALAEEIRTLIDNRAEAARLGACARTIFQRDLTWPRITELIQRVCRPSA